MLRALGQDAAAKARQTSHHLEEFASSDEIDPSVDRMVVAAAAAQTAFASWPEARVEALLHRIAEAAAAQAEELAAATVAETGIGNVADKTFKNRFASLQVNRTLQGKPGVGPRPTDDRGVTEIASPVEVVLGLIPMTNPVSTVVFKTLICLKARNALMISHHPAAVGVGSRTVELTRAVLRDDQGTRRPAAVGRARQPHQDRHVHAPPRGGPHPGHRRHRHSQGGLQLGHAGDRRGLRQRARLDLRGRRPGGVRRRRRGGAGRSCAGAGAPPAAEARRRALRQGEARSAGLVVHVEGQEQGLSVCQRLLANQGSGHTAVIHSNDERLQQRFGEEIPASRILVNSPATLGCLGIGNRLVPSLTLGCGTFGGNSTTDNVTYTNLLNIKRLARPA